MQRWRRRYLASQAELPDQTLTVTVSASDAALSANSPQTASDKTSLLDLHTDKEDAMVRLAAIQAQAAVAQRPLRLAGGRGPKVLISFASCHEQLPHPEVFAQCLLDSFQEYHALATVAA